LRKVLPFPLPPHGVQKEARRPSHPQSPIFPTHSAVAYVLHVYLFFEAFFSADLMHPNEVGYDWWARSLAEQIHQDHL